MGDDFKEGWGEYCLRNVCYGLYLFMKIYLFGNNFWYDF